MKLMSLAYEKAMADKQAKETLAEDTPVTES